MRALSQQLSALMRALSQQLSAGARALSLFLAALALAFALIGHVPPASAQSRLPPAPYAYRQIDDPAQEARARALMNELRCLVCQGQSIADSDAPLAGDMRSQVREKIMAGESPDAIRDWLIARYGNWVSYSPPFAADTAILYLAPLLALLIGLWLALGQFRKPRSARADNVEANGQ